MKILFVIYLVFINAAAFLLYGLDKHKAQKGQWRVSENTLLGVAFLGGSVGAFLGMRTFHHKTKHWKFRILIPVFSILHILLLMLIK